CQRCSILVTDMTATLHAGRSTIRDQNWKVLMVVNTGVAQPASVQVHRVIEQRAIAVGSGFQFLEKLRELRNVERIDLGNLEEFFRIVAMMAGGMVRVRDADFRIRTVIELAGHLEGDERCYVVLTRQCLQLEKDLRVVGRRRRPGSGPSPVRATAAACRDRSASPQPGRRWCPDSSPNSRCAWRRPRSGIPRSPCRACPGRIFPV